MSDERLHAISFDVEEFFQTHNLEPHYPRERWDEVPSRLDVGMDAILSSLERHGAHATFFFLGWIAERRPELVRRCLAGGHEIASHGYEHRFLADLGRAGLEADLERTERALVAAGAPRPTGFRASTFSLTRATEWAFDVLIERGYAYDSSVHPIAHPNYGIPDFDPGISLVRRAGGAIVEFPVATLRMLGRNWPVGGGGYFRLLPGAAFRAALARVERGGRPAGLYLHPWEFDPDQPRLPVAPLARFRHYVGLRRTRARLDALLAARRFGTYREVLARERPTGPVGSVRASAPPPGSSPPGAPAPGTDPPGPDR